MAAAAASAAATPRFPAAATPAVPAAPAAPAAAVAPPAAVVEVWPLGKLRAALAKGQGDRPFLAVLLLLGRCSPVHRGHLAAVEQARRRLAAAGYAVVGAWLVPGAAEPTSAGSAELLPESLRLRLAKLAAEREPLVEVSSWAAGGPGRTNPSRGNAASELHTHLRTALSQQSDWLTTFAVIGSDEYLATELPPPAASPRKAPPPLMLPLASVRARPPPLEVVSAISAVGSAQAKVAAAPADDAAKAAVGGGPVNVQSMGLVVVPRAGFAAPPERKRDLLFVAEAASAVAGAAVRTALRNGDLAVFAAAVPAAVARLLASPSAAEWSELGQVLAKFGTRPPPGATAPRESAPRPPPPIAPPAAPVVAATAAAAPATAAASATTLPRFGTATAAPAAPAAPIPAAATVPAAAPKPVAAVPAAIAAPGTPAAAAPAPVPVGVPCGVCGFRGTAVTARFCSECGSRLVQRTGSPSPAPAAAAAAPAPGAAAGQAGLQAVVAAILLPPVAALAAPAPAPVPTPVPAPAPPPAKAAAPPAPPPAGSVASKANIKPPAGTNVQTLEALDHVVEALGKQGLSLERVFRSLDADRNGVLERNHFVEGMRLFTGSQVAEEDLLCIWTAADRTQDGRLTLTDFFAFLGRLPAHVAEAKKLQATAVPAGGATPAPAAAASASAAAAAGSLEVPPALWLTSERGQRHCSGRYVVLAVERANGAPVWKHESADLWLYTNPSGLWCIGDTAAWEKKFAHSSCFVYCGGDAARSGALPQRMPAGSWHFWDEHSAAWAVDAGITVSERPSAAELRRLAAALAELQWLREQPRGSKEAERRSSELAMLGLDLMGAAFEDDEGAPLLLLAADRGWHTFVAALCARARGRRSYLDAQRRGTGWTALLLAARHGDEASVEMLLAAKASVNMASTVGGLTPLMLASDIGQESLVSRLLGARADASVRDCNGRTALDFAEAQAARASAASTAAAATAAAAAEPASLAPELQDFGAVRLLQQAAQPPAVQELPPAADSRAPRRRTRTVAYDEGDCLDIDWLIEDGAAEVVVLRIGASDAAQHAGVRPGWALLSVDGGQDLLRAGHAERQRLRLLQPPLRLEFGRPLDFPEELWLARASAMLGEARQPRLTTRASWESKRW